MWLLSPYVALRGPRRVATCIDGWIYGGQVTEVEKNYVIKKKNSKATQDFFLVV